MILILSTELDLSTDYVCNWLDKFKGNYKRLHPSDILSSLSSINITNNYSLNNQIKIDDVNINISDINIIWNRKWDINEHVFPINYSNNEVNNNEIYKAIKNENQLLYNYFVKILEEKKWLDYPNPKLTNKLFQLNIANNVGLKTPATILTSKKSELLGFKKEYKEVITKSINTPLTLDDDEDSYTNFTVSIEEDDLLLLPDKFSPSLFQEEIKKEFEIRTFFLEGNCYSMAILSQKDEQTKTDFRHYNKIKPNRNIPYKLPLIIENKINTLMKKIELNTGSIDLIYTKDKEYYFLEVNPAGIYDNVSKFCNYSIDEKIAHYLMKNDYA